MFLLWAIPIGILLGYLRGGRLKNLNSINLKAPWLIFVALAIQLLIFPLGANAPIVNFGTDYFHIASYLILGLFVLLNLREWGIAVMSSGALANFAAIIANGGFMPTRAENLQAAGLITPTEAANLAPGAILGNNIIMGEQTPLWFLGDIFSLPPAIPLANVFSIGDVILALGLIFYLRAKMRS